jgi:hypothetical protein
VIVCVRRIDLIRPDAAKQEQAGPQNWSFRFVKSKNPFREEGPSDTRSNSQSQEDKSHEQN